MRYCVARHAGFLLGYGHPAGDAQTMPETAQEVIDLLRRPTPDADALSGIFARLREVPQDAPLPEPGSDNEGDLFDALGVMFLDPTRTTEACEAVLHAVGPQRLDLLIGLLTFVRTAHYWTEMHPSLTLEPDVFALFEQYPELAKRLLDRSEAERVPVRVALCDTMRELDNARTHLAQTREKLREKERRDTFLLQLTDKLRSITDPVEIQAQAARIIGEHLGVDRALYAEFETDNERYLVERDYSAGMPSIAGRHRPEDFGVEPMRDARAGRTFIVTDAATDSRLSGAERAAGADIGMAARVVAPLVKDGRLAAMFVVMQATARTWTADEVTLVEEIAERTWAAVKRARAERALKDSEAKMQHILDGVREYAIITIDPQGNIASWNSGAEHLLGYREAEALGRSGAIFFTPEDRKAHKVEREMELARTQGRASNERWHVRKDGTRFWGSGVMLPLSDEQGGSMVKIFRDNTGQREAEQHRTLLMHELNHRVKNTLAVVQAIASQTMRGFPEAREIGEALDARLVSLAKAHDLLTASNWEGGDLGMVVRDTLRILTEAQRAERVHIRGETLQLRPKALLSLSMALHELITNAVKYGALSNRQVYVDIAWEVTPHAPRRVRFRWMEHGGPPVSAPTRCGFGSRLLTQALAQDVAGEVHMDFPREGVVFTLDAPLDEMESIEPAVKTDA
ncbi:MAG TPA: HWE histidine kinase domain-containing protein [Rhodanobacteraceae bacterium]|nr:HWE histidine kinase domain-containing protein [Rhodanobacteraceae bacterium]